MGEMRTLPTLSLMAVLAVLLAVAEAAPRAKRQISPAVQLEDMLSLYGFHQPGAKRSLVDLKRHIAPSMDADADIGSLRALMNVGKRQISYSAELPRTAELYTHLFDAGRKRGAISPAADLEHQIAMSNFLEMAGRR